LGAPQAPVQRPVLITSAQGAYWKEAVPTAVSGSATVTVTDQTSYQTWLGFGGTFNEAGWDALLALSDAERQRAIRLLFSAAEGAHFAWGRIPMGSSDYALERHTYNDHQGNYAMDMFSIDIDRELLIPYIHAAQSVKSDIKFWGSPWTPPPWMKTVEEYDGTNLLPDKSNEASAWQAKMKSDAQTLDAYALYFARFIEEYGKECIPLDHVHPQNEPGYSTRYPSCLWDPGLLGTFVGEHLGPTLQERGLATKIWFGTLSNPDTYQGHINGLTGAAASFVQGVGLQWNTMPHVGELDDNYLVMQSEHKCGNYPWNTTTATSVEAANESTFLPGMAPNNYNYALESWGLIKQWIEAGVNIYSAWNMVLDTQGQNLDEARPWPQNALLVVDRGKGELIETPTYYVFRHLSYFVDPGATRIAASGGNALAFKNPDGSIVTIIHNPDTSPAQTTVSVGGTTQQFQIPARGWATLNFKE
jgi:glucosylceramidase